MGRSPSTSVAGFTGKREKWLRNDGGARRVPGMPKPCPRVAKRLYVRLRCPARIPMARGGVAVAIGNHLFLVAATKMEFTGSWHAHGACEGPLFLSRLPKTATSTCMDSICVTYTSSKHAITVHILCVAP